MPRRKWLMRLLLGGLAGAGVIGARALRERTPDTPLSSSPQPPTPDATAHTEPPVLPEVDPPAEVALPEQAEAPQPAETPKLAAKPRATAKPRAEAKPEQAAKPDPAPKAKPAAKTGPGAKAGPAKDAQSRSREELYREAKRLGIEGRSKMSKGELERAVEKAHRG